MYTTNLCKWKEKIHRNIKEMDTDRLSHTNATGPLPFMASPLLISDSAFSQFAPTDVCTASMRDTPGHSLSAVLRASQEPAHFWDWAQEHGPGGAYSYLSGAQNGVGPQGLCRTSEHVPLPTSVHNAEEMGEHSPLPNFSIGNEKREPNLHNV